MTQNSETILLVENDPAVRFTVNGILSAAGFKVIVAEGCDEAFLREKDCKGVINLLLTDVQLPGSTGPDLGKALQDLRPDMHVMLISGFPGGDLLVLNYGWYFIQRDSVATVLVERINEVLHTPRRDQGTDRFLSEPSVLGVGHN